MGTPEPRIGEATATVTVLYALDAQLVALEEELAAALARHPQAGVLLSQPGLGMVLAARVLGEFGDDPARYQTANGRKAYAGTAPITRASGTKTVVSARVARNDRLANACTQWTFAALSASPGARRCYDRHRAAGNSHAQALRALGNRLVGILHGCLASHVVYQEQIAWPDRQPAVPEHGRGCRGRGSLPRPAGQLIARSRWSRRGSDARASRVGRRPIAQRREAPLTRRCRPRSPAPSRPDGARSPPATAGGGRARVSYRLRLARCGRPAHAPFAPKGAGMRVLVTGGTGYLGSHTVAALVEGGHDVRLLVRAPQRVAAAVAPLGLQLPDLDTVVGDVTDPEAVQRAVRGCEAVVHAASVYSFDSRDARRIRQVTCAAPTWCWARRTAPGWTRSCTSPASWRCCPPTARPDPRQPGRTPARPLPWVQDRGRAGRAPPPAGWRAGGDHLPRRGLGPPRPAPGRRAPAGAQHPQGPLPDRPFGRLSDRGRARCGQGPCRGPGARPWAPTLHGRRHLPALRRPGGAARGGDRPPAAGGDRAGRDAAARWAGGPLVQHATPVHIPVEF